MGKIAVSNLYAKNNSRFICLNSTKWPFMCDGSGLDRVRGVTVMYELVLNHALKLISCFVPIESVLIRLVGRGFYFFDLIRGWIEGFISWYRISVFWPLFGAQRFETSPSGQQRPTGEAVNFQDSPRVEY